MKSEFPFTMSDANDFIASETRVFIFSTQTFYMKFYLLKIYSYDNI